MKFIKLSTTSSLYLLTLLLIFGIIFLNQAVFAQSESQRTLSDKRLDVIVLYKNWADSGEYGEYKKDLGRKTLAEFKKFLAKVVPEDQQCLKEQDPAKLSECKGKIKADYKLAKKYNRALKYFQIEEEKPNVCVKADLGVGTALKARGFNPTKVDPDDPENTGNTLEFPVYLCTGNDGKKKVRVVDDSGTKLRLSKDDALRVELKAENLPPKESFDKLLGKIGIIPPVEENAAETKE